MLPQQREVARLQEAKALRQDPKQQRAERVLAHVLKDRHLEEVADYNFLVG